MSSSTLASSSPEISIPSYATAAEPKPHTVFNVVVRLPLRSFTLPKRYSDFTTLHSQLESLVGESPQTKLPPKTFLTSSVTNSELAETRRVGLEAYLRDILTSTDSRWRDSPAWRQFLNLPSSVTGQQAASVGSHLAMSDPKSSPVTDPVLWLDLHRELKSRLQEARLHLSNREQSNSPSEQLNASAAAKKNLVRAGGFIEVLDTGLRAMSSGNASASIGEGEIRRRRDLVAMARKEKDALETLANSIAHQKSDERWSSTHADRTGAAALWSNSTRDRAGGGTGGRVLGGPLSETSRTRELDNTGVLRMQQEVLQDQDRDLEALLSAVRRQKQLGLDIGDEIDMQNQLLNSLDVDVDRVEGKLNVAQKRIKRLG